MTMLRTPSHRLPVLVAGLAVAISLTSAACSSDDEPAATSSTSVAPTTSATSSSTSQTTPPGSHAAEAAYRAFWSAYLKAADPMRPADPALARYAAGQELDQVRQAFTTHLAKNEVIRGRLDLDPTVESISSHGATITDCYLDATHVFDATTGTQKDADGEKRFQVKATLLLRDDTWKVSSISKEGEGCTPA
jgi:hypothetical protein